MSANSKNASETNANQADLAKQQATTQAALIAAERANNTQINADLGTGSTVPHPGHLPSVAGVMGPHENDILAGLTSSSQSTHETQAAAAVDPNETGILATFAASAHGANGSLKDETLQLASAYGTQASSAEALIASSSAASQTALAGDVGTTSNPLGSQISSVPSYTVGTPDGGADAGETTAAPASSSGRSPVLAIGALIALAAGGLYVFRKHL